MASFRNLLLDDDNAVSHPSSSLAAPERDTTRLFNLQPLNPKKHAVSGRALLVLPSSSNLSKLPRSITRMAAANIAYTMKPVRYDPVYCLENPSRLGRIDPPSAPISRSCRAQPTVPQGPKTELGFSPCCLFLAK
jgi:hypothetical protein